MQSNQIIIINGTLRAIGAFLLLSRRAHLLTTRRALSEGCGSVGALRKLPQSRHLPCGYLSDNRIVNAAQQH